MLTQINSRFVLYQIEVCYTNNPQTFIKVLLKDCWWPHKECLGRACGSQNDSWEPLLRPQVPNLGYMYSYGYICPFEGVHLGLRNVALRHKNDVYLIVAKI